jgi:hypothetical protein
MGMMAGLVTSKKEEKIAHPPIAVPAPGGISPALPPTAPGRGNPADDKLVEQFADAVCKCKDMACFQKTAMSFGQKMGGRQPDMNSPKAMAALTKMSQCAQKLSGR